MTQQRTRESDPTAGLQQVQMNTDDDAAIGDVDGVAEVEGMVSGSEIPCWTRQPAVLPGGVVRRRCIATNAYPTSEGQMAIRRC